MDITTILTEVSTWEVADRIQLAQAIWDGVAIDQIPDELSDKQKQQFDQRIAELESNPAGALTWEQIKSHVQREKP